MSENKTLFLDVVPSSQENLTAAIERVENIALSAAGAARHLVEPVLDAVDSTRKYLKLDHTQVVDATVGYAAKLADQQRGFLNDLGDTLLGKPAPRQNKSRSTAAAA